ncbi:unnamed protein product [Rotaria magnacalcarata]
MMEHYHQYSETVKHISFPPMVKCLNTRSNSSIDLSSAEIISSVIEICRNVSIPSITDSFSKPADLNVSLLLFLTLLHMRLESNRQHLKQ